MTRERFAPSPTGLLHLGHAYSALCAYNAARNSDGDFLLRIEDIDTERSKPAFETAIYEDLHWLGLDWETPVLHQSNRMEAYRAALARLANRDLTYSCSCNRSDIKLALSAMQEDVTFGPDGPVYPGTCRNGPVQGGPQAIRLNMNAALTALNIDAVHYSRSDGQLITTSAEKLITTFGDIVLARKDIGTSYHLSVVVDDAFQGITHVTRGADMESATPVHRVLQLLLGLPAPIYRHHDLIRDQNGKRLAKRFDAMAIRTYRQQGLSPDDVKAFLPPMPLV